MPNYGLKYFGEFDNVNNERYRLEIYQKDYSGINYAVTFGATPVVHKWQTDDPFAPIKGSSLLINLINNGSLPLTSFYSESDNGFKVVLSHNSNILFIGFLVQDDFIEPLQDFTHEITLSANDSIGLLKDVLLNNDNNEITNYIWQPCEVQYIAPHTIRLYDCNYIPTAGSSFYILNDATKYTVGSQAYGPGYQIITVTQTIADVAFNAATLYTQQVFETKKRNSLFSIIERCLLPTNLPLDIYVYSSLIEKSQHFSNSFLQQTYVDTKLFFSSDKFDNCYSILEKIMTTFRCSLFQSNGVWNIIRWDELRYNTGRSYIYSYTNLNGNGYAYQLIGTGGILTSSFMCGYEQLTYPETGITKQPIRPLKYAKETFKFGYAVSLIYNYDLSQLGTIYSSVVDGNIRTNQYLFPDDTWLHLYGDNSRIFTRYNLTTEKEIERYIYQNKVTGGTQETSGCIELNPVEVSKDDLFDFLVDFQCANDPAGNFGCGCSFYLRTSANDWYNLFHTPGGFFTWQLFSGAIVISDTGNHTQQIFSATEWDKWNTYTLSSFAPIPTFPADGLLYIRIYGTNNYAPAGVDTLIQNIRLGFANTIRGTTLITGQLHTDEQSPDIKNASDINIVLDDSPRNTIDGTLFNVTIAPIIQQRTITWVSPSSAGQLWLLGQIMTYDQIFYKAYTRNKLEGTLYGLIQSGVHLSLLQINQYNSLEGLKFVFGSLQIDYRANSFNATMWEIFNISDVAPMVDNKYTFTYTYGK